MTVTVPIWTLVLAWGLIGWWAGDALVRAGLSEALIGDPTLGDRIMRRSLPVRLAALGAILLACGPFRWAQVVLVESWHGVRRGWKAVRRG